MAADSRAHTVTSFRGAEIYRQAERVYPYASQNLVRLRLIKNVNWLQSGIYMMWQASTSNKFRAKTGHEVRDSLTRLLPTRDRERLLTNHPRRTSQF